MRRLAALALLITLSLACLATPPPQAPEYQKKFAGDPARSNADFAALGYMRTVLSAQRVYYKKAGKYATSLSQLVNKGSFTRRMVKTDRGDYTVSFRGTGKGFSLALTPKAFDAEHRAFFMNESGTLRTEALQPATGGSEVLRPE